MGNLSRKCPVRLAVITRGLKVWPLVPWMREEEEERDLKMLRCWLGWRKGPGAQECRGPLKLKKGRK